jgi:hypothetical protein
MNSIEWLTKHRFVSITRRDYEWVFAFDAQAQLVVSCLWRLIENGRIRFTSEDHGHKFGLPAPVDAAFEVNQRLKGATIIKVELRDGTLDMSLRFDSGHILEVVPDSSGYEAWQLNNLTGKGTQYIAVGGGELAIFGRPTNKASS